MSEPDDPPREFFEALPRKHVAAGCVFLDDAGRVLLVKPAYKQPWEIPGGGVEHGESPLDACRRELREELAVDWPVLGLLGVDYRHRVDDVRGDALRFVFYGGAVTAAQVAEIRLLESELREHRFVAVSELREFLIPPMSRRLQAMLAGHTYTEEGHPLIGGALES